MEKSLLEELQKIKSDSDFARETAPVCICNDRKVRKDYRIPGEIDSEKEFGKISEYFSDAARSYASYWQYDSIRMRLILGLVFEKKDVNGFGFARQNAEPLDDVVRYYTGSVRSFRHGIRSNALDYVKYGFPKDGYIRFSDLMEQIRQSGLEYDGPETFEEFKERILVGCPFNISLSAHMNSKKQPETKTDNKQFIK